MTYELQINRYGVTTPTHVSPEGTSISCPNYIVLSLGAKKLLAEQARSVVADQLKEMGHKDVSLQTFGQLVTAEPSSVPEMTPFEKEMGASLQIIRDSIWSRNGMKDSYLIKLQSLLGVCVVTREQIEATHKAWLDYLFNKNEEQPKGEPKATSKPAKTTTRRNTRKKAEETASNS